MKSTSWAPVVAIVVVLALAGLMMIRSLSLDAQGASGPLMVSGIFPFTEEFYPSSSGRGFYGGKTIKIIVDDTELANIPGLRINDTRQGIEAAPWEEIVLVAEDRHPVTSSVIRGLAEIITAQHRSKVLPLEPARYPVVILQPVDGDPLPIGCQRVIRVATVGAAPEQRDEAIDVSVSLAHQDLLPALNTAAVWDMWPASSIAEQAIRVSYKQKPLQRVAWADRFVALGRDIAEEALLQFTDAGVVSLDTDALNLSDFHGPWASQIPQQSSHTVVRWFGSIQTPLIRGWAGKLIGQRAQYRGQERDSLELFAEHLGRGEWEARHVEASDKNLQAGEWRNVRVGSLQRLWMEGDDFGWDVLGVEPNAKVGELIRDWLSKAAAGDRVARIQLRRHLAAQFLSDEQRAKAQAILRDQPDAKELAMLGELADATAEELAAKATAQWVFGYSKANVHADLSAPTLGRGAFAWDGRPLLLKAYNNKVVFVQQAAGFVEARWREPGTAAQVWIGAIDDMANAPAPVLVKTSDKGGFAISAQ